MTDSTAGSARPFSTRLAWYAVAVLMVAYTFSFIDRSILSLLVVPVRRDLQISDTQFSLLHGLAFAVFYTALGMPIARLADRYSRRVIITVSVLVWSLATVVCGLARSFGELFAARVVVGVGEAGLSPAAYSMIADMFPKESLGRALGVYSSGVFMGGGLALIIGGAVISAVGESATFAMPLVGDVRGWQLTFFLVGLPGVLIALLTWLLREPPRQPGPAGTAASAIPLREVFAFIGRNRSTFLTHFLGFSALALLYNAVFAWAPALLIRRFAVAGGDAGLYLGTIMLVFATSGIVAGGWFTDWLARAGRVDAPIRTGLIAALALAPLVVATPLMPNLPLTLVAFCPLMFFISFPWAAAAAALQIVAPPRMRAQVSAAYLFVVNLAGIGLGPFLTALVTDYVFGDDAALPYSLALVGLGAALTAGVLLYRCQAHFRHSAAVPAV